MKEAREGNRAPDIEKHLRYDMQQMMVAEIEDIKSNYRRKSANNLDNQLRDIRDISSESLICARGQVDHEFKVDYNDYSMGYSSELSIRECSSSDSED